VGAFFPPLLILNIALHFRSEDPYLKRWATFSWVALAIWVTIIALWVIVAQVASPIPS
ncbi:hypothetical protein T484DRAFT_1870614, partial [Baffinella frigidus]